MRIKVQLDQLNKDVMMKSSPMRFGDGGRARLARLARNHQVAISGRMIWIPRARRRVRL